MSRSNYRTFPLSRIEPMADIARIILPLMMCLNDITLAQSEFAAWDAEKNPRRVRRRHGAKLYFGRMLYIHVNEALDHLEDIHSNPTFLNELARCNPKTQDSYNIVADFINSNQRKMLTKLRNMAGFHYDEKLAQRALAKLQRSFPEAISTHSAGSDPLDTYFPLGDLLVDRIVVGPAMNVDLDVENREELDRIEQRMNQMIAAFQDFSVNLLRYTLAS